MQNKFARAAGRGFTERQSSKREHAGAAAAARQERGIAAGPRAKKSATPLKPERGKKRKPTMAVKVYYKADGSVDREVCQDNSAGRASYAVRKAYMWQRDSGLCCICGKFVRWEESTFEHKGGRGMGGARRDDRVEKNGVAHLRCNLEKGSKRGGK